MSRPSPVSRATSGLIPEKSTGTGRPKLLSRSAELDAATSSVVLAAISDARGTGGPPSVPGRVDLRRPPARLVGPLALIAKLVPPPAVSPLPSVNRPPAPWLGLKRNSRDRYRPRRS